MNRQIRDKWVKALLSGDYTQGKNALKQSDGAMCCLGVLADTLEGCTWLPDAEKDGFFRMTYKDYPPLMSSTLDDPILNDVGMTDDDQSDLISLNDTEGKTFPEIAQWITVCLGLSTEHKDNL